MRRDSGVERKCRKAEYRNRKNSMATGWTEEERSTGGTADRGEREEGKGKSGRLSSQNRAEADERKRMRGESPKARARGKHRWNSCGSEAGRDERKRTGSRVRRNGRDTRETGWNGSGGARKPKGREAAPDGAAVRRRGEEEERKKQKAK